MNKGFEKTYHEVEAEYWWFVTRRRLVKEMVCRAAPDRNAAILEIGCSGGPLLQQLKDCGYTDVKGIDISPEAIALCRKRNLAEVWVMDAQRPDFPPGSFDVIIASDVLEHIEEAPRTVAAWHNLLRPGGTLLVFVPAFNSLWSAHDTVNHHFRRYRSAELAGHLKSAGFEIRRQGYWNFFLFLPVAVMRLAKRIFPKTSWNLPAGDLVAVPGWLNSLLVFLLQLENRLILMGLDFPWGVSALVIARKRAAAPAVNCGPGERIMGCTPGITRNDTGLVSSEDGRIRRVKDFLLQKKQFLLYCVIGGCGTVLDFSIYSLLLYFSILDYQAANAIGYASGTLLSFILNARFNFRVTDKIHLRFACFFAVALLGWATSAGLLRLLIGQFHFDKYLSKMAALVVVVILQYNLNRRFSFRKAT